MAIRFYDDAIYDKIQRWVRDPKMRILKPEETTRLLQMRADQGDDKPIQLPLISLSREKSIKVDYTNKKPLSFDGLKLGMSDKLTAQLDAVPVSIKYQIDIYTRKYDEGDEYVRNFVFNIINYPKLSVNIPYNNFDLSHTAYISLLDTINDNSDIKERLFSGQFTRWTIEFEVKDAYLFSVPYNVNYEIGSTSLEIHTINDVTGKEIGESVEEPIVINT